MTPFERLTPLRIDIPVPGYRGPETQRRRVTTEQGSCQSTIPGCFGGWTPDLRLVMGSALVYAEVKPVRGRPHAASGADGERRS